MPEYRLRPLVGTERKFPEYAGRIIEGEKGILFNFFFKNPEVTMEMNGRGKLSYIKLKTDHPIEPDNTSRNSSGEFITLDSYLTWLRKKYRIVMERIEE